MLKKQIVIIGAGVSGSAIAMELSRKQLDVLVVERASDVCEGTSKANSGIVHAGYDAKPGSLKAKLNVEGNRMMQDLADRLDFPFKRLGSLVLCFEKEGIPSLIDLYDRGCANGVEDLVMYGDIAAGLSDARADIPVLDLDELRSLEPNVSDNVVAALFAPTGGIVDPFLLNIAMAENACENGVEFSLDTEVKNIRKDSSGSGYILEVVRHPSLRNGIKEDTPDEIQAQIVINAAGVYADVFHNMVSENKIHITPRKGEYCLLDKKTEGCIKHTLFQLPTKMGKGVLVTPTTHGNTLIGPTAEDVTDHDTVDTSAAGLDKVIKTGSLSVKDLPSKGNIITSFAGLRAHEDGGDFIIKELEDAPGFIDVAGIESPGLTCAPAIGVYVAGIVEGIVPAADRTDYKDTRKGIPSVAHSDDETRAKLVEADPLYSRVICRCELVTEGEIVDAINRPLGATTLDGIKRRVRAGMGRCQAGFCTPLQVRILARELGVGIDEITKKGDGSELLTGDNKDNEPEIRK